jgi:hypothetical protein
VPHCVLLLLVSTVSSLDEYRALVVESSRVELFPDDHGAPTRHYYYYHYHYHYHYHYYYFHHHYCSFSPSYPVANFVYPSQRSSRLSPPPPRLASQQVEILQPRPVGAIPGGILVSTSYSACPSTQLHHSA